MSKIGAFFDLDGTLYREGLITEVFKKMVKYEIIAPERWYNEVKPHFLKWDKRQGDYDNYLLKMVDVYLEAIKGLEKHQVEHIAQKVVEQKGDRVYTFTRDRIKWHKEQGHIIIIISGSPSELVREMANKYGFNDYKGTIYMVDKKDMYTSEVIPMWDSESKSKAINELVEKYDIDLNKSYAYGDTSGDYTMFKHVGHPFCINPTKELLQKVMSDNEVTNKVNVIVERKDVIYNLNIEDIQFV
ncbi:MULTISPECIES: HAD-IB family hydrolase [Clostridium]|uniref:phosphoserine phosphatase n=1 Tax=Clostridium aquiflavi TaxID=3073603 RepID=A0ABU1EJ19_9CLOT|nr:MULTISPECIES: HAD-IB family hydrolase [unclassified Clostridium]MDR5588387.1 HAD-IB family hydrolase [Clostridium sp. 5N-1]NFG62238.1 HAD-IB family hydrolase [Clostridium botulinum]NFQ09725.1 HAD-IB family hydrolase [Clostridium botulinum]